MAEGRCGTEGCGRFVRAGARRCRVHGGDEDERAGAPTERPAVEEFRRRLADRDYRGLYGAALAAVLDQAAAERGLADEIGALRVTLARLLVEEQDPTRLATAVARVAGVAVQAARAQRTLAGEQAEGLTAALAQVLAELEQE